MRTTTPCPPSGMPVPRLNGIWQRWHRLLSTLIALAFLAAALFFTTKAYSQSPCPTGNCTSGDMQITKVELLKPDGSALPQACDPYQHNVTVIFRVTFDVTADNRYGFLATAKVWINDSLAGTIAGCQGGAFSKGLHTMDITSYAVGGPILWPCGSTIQLKSVYTAWDQQAETASHPGICSYLSADGSINNCDPISPKCKYYGDGNAFTVYAPLIADFTYSGSCTAGHLAQTIAFTNTTSGGKAGYTYLWNFGDGSANSTATNPSHDYATAGNYTVSLTATDASSPTALVDQQSYSVTVGSCCTPPNITAQPSNQSKCQATSATFTVGFTGGTPAPVIKWQVDAGSGFNDISNNATYSGASSASLTVSGVTPNMNGYRYRAVLQSGTCTAVTTDAATLNVSASTNAGTLSSSNTICSGSTSGLLTLNGYTGDILRWESSPNGSTGWTSIGNASSATYTSGALTADTWYRVVVKSGVCDAANSNPVKITINRAPVVTSNPSNQGKCETSTATFSVTYTDGLPAASIRWQVNTGSGFTNISDGGVYSGATTATLTLTGVTPSLDGNQYRAVLQSGVCAAVNSASATLNVSASTVPGTLSASKIICSGTNSGTLALSGYTGSILRWESSPTGISGSWSSIANSFATYTSGTLSGDIWFRAIVQSGFCEAMPSGAIKITVQQPISNNSIASSQTICSGNAPASLTGSTPTGGSGTYTYQWQSATTGSFANISGANSINYPPGNLGQTTRFRRIVSGGACDPSTSDAVTISISPESVVYPLMASNYCNSNTEKGTIVLGGSYPGVSYQLMKSDNSAVQDPKLGDGDSLTWTGVQGGTYYVVGTGMAPTFCQSTTLSATVHEFDCSAFYTLTQGYYGNKNGKTCIGTTPVNTIKFLLASTDLIVGSTNTVTVPASNDGAVKLNSVLPGGGTPIALPVGTCTITNQLCFKFPNYLTKQNKINNNLLSQTITLMLNTRWDEGRLALFQLKSGWLTTQKLLGCGNSTVVVTQCADGVISSIRMNQNVIDYLGANNTVQDLLNLANGVLGGTLIPGQNGVPSYSDINDAVDAINKSFDEGRRFLDYYTEKQTCESLFPASSTIVSTFGTGRETTQSQLIAASKGVSVTAYPNPYTDKVSFTVESDIAGYGSLQVYNMMGQKVKTVYQGFMSAGKQYFTLTLPTQQRANLVYLLTIGGKQVTGKLMQLRQ